MEIMHLSQKIIQKLLHIPSLNSQTLFFEQSTPLATFTIKSSSTPAQTPLLPSPLASSSFACICIPMSHSAQRDQAQLFSTCPGVVFSVRSASALMLCLDKYLDGLLRTYLGRARHSLTYCLSKTFVHVFWNAFHTESDFPKRLNHKTQWGSLWRLFTKLCINYFLQHTTAFPNKLDQPLPQRWKH